jgi:hypothetical protein
MDIKEIASRSGFALAIGTIAGLDANSLFTLIHAMANQAYVKNNPYTTEAEYLLKWATYVENRFRGGMMATALGLAFVTIIIATLFRPIWKKDSSTDNNLHEASIEQDGLPFRQASQSLCKAASIGAVAGLTIDGGVALMRNWVVRGYPQWYAERYAPTAIELFKQWAGEVEIDIILGLVITLSFFVVLTPTLAASFWRRNASHPSERVPIFPQAEPSTVAVLPIQSDSSTSTAPRLGYEEPKL